RGKNVPHMLECPVKKYRLVRIAVRTRIVDSLPDLNQRRWIICVINPGWRNHCRPDLPGRGVRQYVDPREDCRPGGEIGLIDAQLPLRGILIYGRSEQIEEWIIRHWRCDCSILHPVGLDGRIAAPKLPVVQRSHR